MPLFEYVCKNCGKQFERIVPRHDSLVDCPHCASAAVEKQLSVFAVSTSQNSDAFQSSPGCGRCGAPEPGMCQM
ncbi:MAG TPA: zinc ribbon domain-containing protein [Terriglobia bacterium]|nr:zinc ribbon domain-containing protein [Terriglobia bacterium]